MADPILPGPPDIAVPASYWNQGAASMDEQKKRYRSIPVPALLNDNQKHVDDRTRLELLVEHIATKDDFGDFDMRQLFGLPPEQQVWQIQEWIKQVEEAPEEKKADAQRSFFGHMGDFGKSIGGGLLSAANTVLGAPGISHTLSALSVPGEEVTAQILYNIATVIPGEQDIERGVAKWRKENPDAPWWKRHTLTSAVREEGFGVPMGVHLPMEIIFDPINLIPFGAVAKAAKPTALMLKLMRSGKNSREAFEITRRVRRLQREFNRKEKALAGGTVGATASDIDEGARIADETVYEDVADPVSGAWQGSGEFDPLTGTWGRGRQAHRRYKTGDEAEEGYKADDPNEPLRKEDIEVKNLTRDDVVVPEQPQDVKNVLGVGANDSFDAGDGVPTIRGKPLHGSETDPRGLFAIINDDAYWGELGPEGVKAKWALRLMYYTGIRPHEIPYVQWGDILNLLEQEGHWEKLLTLRMKEARGKSKSKTSQRLLTDDAFEFFKRYRDEVGKTRDDVDFAAFELPKSLKGEEDSISGLNKMFEDAANNPKHQEYGPGLLDFYRNKQGTGGNYTYVFRLSKANDFFSKQKHISHVSDLKRLLGHGSTAHTSRYVSLFQHEVDTTVDGILKTFGGFGDVDGVFDNTVWAKATADAQEVLNNGTWRDALAEPDKLDNLGVFSVINRGVMNRKGFGAADQNAAIQALNGERYKFLKSALSAQFRDPEKGRSYIADFDDWAHFSKQTKADLEVAAAGLEQLQTLVFNLAEAIVEKNIIRTSKEVKEWRKSAPVIKPKKGRQTNAFRELGDEAAQQIGMMQEWYQPISRLANEYLEVLEAGTIKVGAKKQGAYSKVIADIAKPFKMIVMAELNKMEALSKRGSGGSRAEYRRLTDIPLFDNIMKLGRKNKKTKLPTALAEKAKRFLESEDGIAQLKQLEEGGIGYILHPDPKGKGVGGRENPHYVAKSHRDLWMIVGYKTVDGSEWVPGANYDIASVTLEKLAQQPFKETTISRAKYEQTIDVNVLDFSAWSLHLDNPFPEHMVRMAAHGGKQGLSAEEVAEMLFKFKHDASGSGGWRHMTGVLNDEYSIRRLRDNGLVERIPGTDPYEYRWSKEVLEAFNVERADGLRGKESSSWGYGVFEEAAGVPKATIAGAGEPPKPPPSRPGTNTNPDMPEEIPIENELFWVDDKGIRRTLADTIRIPRAMNQVMTFMGEKFAERFSRLPFKFQKVLRTMVPGTFGATEAAKLRWKYIMSKSEGQEVASNLGHMLDGMHKDFGSNRRDGRGKNIVLKDGNKGINPNTGEFLDPRQIQKDYYRKEGVRITPGDSRFNKEVADAMFEKDYVDGNWVYRDQMLGPVAMMEQKFIQYADEFPERWTPDVIKRERRKYNHLQVMQDMTTFLNTSRADLHLFYDLSTVAGQKQLVWWDKYHQVQPHLLDLLRKAGYDIDNDVNILGQLTEDMRTSFTPSLFLETDKSLLQGASSLGMKPSQMKERKYHWQIQNKMDNGMESGLIKHGLYNTDPILAIQRTAEAYYDFIAMERFMDEYSKLGYLTAELKDVDSMKDLVINYSRGDGTLSDAEQIVATKFFGPNWRNMTPSQVDKRIEKLHSMSAAWRNQGLKESVQDVVPEHRLHDTALPPDASNELKALIQDVFQPQNPFLTVPSAISNAMRVLATGADLGVMLLHGIGGIGMMASPNPFLPRKQRFAWAKGVKNMGHALWNPEVRTRWYEQTQLTRADMQKYGVGFFRSTHVEDLPLPGLFTKGKIRPGLQRPGLKQMSQAGSALWSMPFGPERMINGFGFFLDVSKTEMWKAQAQAIRQHIGSVDNMGNPTGKTLEPHEITAENEALNDLAAAMNAIHGTLQPAAIGMPQKQRVFESAFLMYAALYKRSAVAMIGNMMSGVPSGLAAARKGDLRAGWETFQTRKWRRNQALQSVSGMLMAGAALGWAIQSLGWNDDFFEPGSPDFMSLKTGGLRMGIGTPYYSLTRVAKDVIDQMGEDPAGLAEVNFSDNPLLRFFRSGSSPVTAIGLDLATGQEFIGDPLRDTTGGWEVNKIGTRISRNLVPFWLDSLGDSLVGSKDMHPSSALAEFFGLRVSPLSPYGRRLAAINTAILLSDNPDIVKWREDQEAAGLPANRTTLPNLLLRKLTNDTPELQDLDDQITLDIQRRGSHDRKQQDEYIRQVKLNQEGDGSDEDDGIEGISMRLAGVNADFAAGLLSGKEFREKVELIEYEHRGRNQQLAYTYKEVIERFEERRTGRLNDPLGHFVLDLWYDLYRAHVTGASDLHDVYGNFDAEMFMARQEWFRNEIDSRFIDPETNTPYGWDYIQELRTVNKHLPEHVARLNDARNDKLLPFWNLADEHFSPVHAEYLNQWRGQLTKEAKAYYQQKHPIVLRLMGRLKKIQDRFRKQNPDVDALLVEFYDYSALTPAGKAIERKRQIAAANIPATTPAVFTHPDLDPWAPKLTPYEQAVMR